MTARRISIHTRKWHESRLLSWEREIFMELRMYRLSQNKFIKYEYYYIFLAIYKSLKK